MKKRKIVGMLIMTSFSEFVMAQGCSDAGICTATSAINSVIAGEDSCNQTMAIGEIKWTTSVAAGEQGVFIAQLIPEIKINIKQDLSCFFRITGTYAEGNLGKISGFGDIYTGIIFSPSKIIKKEITLLLSTKIPLSFSDRRQQGKALPMPYQPGLGTYDLIGVASIKYNQWKATTALQFILINKNKNNFLHSRWPDNTDAEKYFESNMLKRGHDGSLKLERYFRWGKTTLNTGVLGIYRLQKDRYKDKDNREVLLSSSDGLTLNLTGSMTLPVHLNGQLQLSTGFPLLVRATRADGLTRSMVFNLTYSYLLNKN